MYYTYRMDVESNLKLQQDYINKVATIVKQYDSVDSIFLVGSHSKGENTPFSDIDICLLFKTDLRENREDIFKRILELSPTLSHLYLFDSEGLFLFVNGIRLDVTFIKPTDFEKLALNKVKIIQDLNGMVAEKYTQTKDAEEKPSKPKWNESEGDFLDWFFWMFRQIYCYILQAGLKPDKRFDKLNSAQSSIKSVRDKLIDMLVYLNNKKDYINSIDKNISGEFEKTYSSLNPTDMLLATRKLADIYEIIGREYAKRINTSFPDAKLVTTKALFNEFDNLYKEIVVLTS